MSADDTLLHDDRRARADALDVTRSFIVQAPAGSGKTELLIQRYLHLLATVDEPEEILAITFTRKAAAEMRLRVLQALRRAQRGELPDEAHLQITARAADKVLERDAAREWRLLAYPRRMRIQTLDSLNSSIARMQPLTTSGAGGNAIAADSELDALYQRAAAASLDWLTERGDSAVAIENVLRHVDNNTGVYVDYLARMLRTRDQWLPFVSSGLVSESQSTQLRAAFENNLERVVSERLAALLESAPSIVSEEILPLVPYAASNLQIERHAASSIHSLADLETLPGTGADSLDAWRGLAEMLLTKAGAIRKRVNKNQGFPRYDYGQKQAMHEALAELAGERRFAAELRATQTLPPVRYSDEQWSVLLSLFRLLPVAVAELRRLCLARGVTDYIEIALGAATALGTAEDPGDVALLLDYQVRHILVDEMQDTSKAQYRMLEALTGGWQRGDGRTLFCVGDPMQSIYRFRNAEVSQFLLAREQGIGDLPLEPLVLRRNFRSGEHLVHWFNDVFPSVLPNHDDAVNGAVSYSHSVPVDRLSGQGETCLYPQFGGSATAEAKTATEVIERLLRIDTEANVAVLVRSRTQLPALLARLRKSGIPYQAVDIDRLTDLPEIIDVLALARAASHLGDRAAWLGVLRSPWIGLDWTDLHTLVQGDTRTSVLALMRDADRLNAISAQGRAAMDKATPILAELVDTDRSRPLHARVERAWFALGGPALLDSADAADNVYRFFDAVSRLESGGTIPDIAELMSQLDAERVSTHVAARVQVLTMHKAKGLQFDHVLLYGLGRYPSRGTKSVLNWFDLPDVHGSEEKVISPVGRRDAVEHDPVHRYIELTEAAKDRHEQGRLLYVACTRAQKSLHLLGNVGVDADGDEIRPPHAGSLLALLWPTVEADYESAFVEHPAASAHEKTPGWVLPELRRLDTGWNAPEVTLPSRGIVEMDDTVRNVDYDWVGMEARLAGTVVHRWLQLATEGRSRLSPSAELRDRSERWLMELGAPAEALERTWQRIHAAVESVLSDAKGRWLIDGDGAAELPLTGFVNGRVESVVIDRVRVDEKGIHWIVDYKTSTHEGGNLAGFLDAEAGRYREQLRKYAAIYGAYSGATVRCALYFPLLAEFVEVPV